MGGGGGQRGVSGERGGQSGVGVEEELGVREGERERGLSAAINIVNCNIVYEIESKYSKRKSEFRVFKITNIPAFSNVI